MNTTKTSREIIKEAKGFLFNNKKNLFSIVFIMGMINIIIYGVGNVLPDSTFFIFNMLMNCILIGPLSVGIVRFLLNTIDNKEAKPSDLLYLYKSPNRNNLLLTSILYLIVSFLIVFFSALALFGLLVLGYNALVSSISVWTTTLSVILAIIFLVIILPIILLIVSILYYLNMRIYIALFLNQDFEGHSAIEYIKKSWSVTKGKYKLISKYYLAEVFFSLICIVIYCAVAILYSMVVAVFVNMASILGTIVLLGGGIVLFAVIIYISLYIASITIAINGQIYKDMRDEINW